MTPDLTLAARIYADRVTHCLNQAPGLLSHDDHRIRKGLQSTERHTYLEAAQDLATEALRAADAFSQVVGFTESFGLFPEDAENA
jgi:hypothetical protein